MKQLINRLWHCCRHYYYQLGAWITLGLMAAPAWAKIPSSPNVPNGDKSDFMKTGQGVFNEGAGFAIDILYVVAILVYCGALLWLLMQAKKKEEWGNFFKGSGIGLAVLVLILILLNQAQTAIGGG